MEIQPWTTGKSSGISKIHQADPESLKLPLSIRTPLLQSLPLSQLHSTAVHMKLEALQPSGSFKMRGIGHACEHYAKQGARRFISSSGGNAGLAVAYAGRKLQLPVEVIERVCVE